MSLLLTIKDKLQPEPENIINKDGPYCLIDESLSFIKMKLFGLLSNIEYYPNFLKFEYKDASSNEYKTIKNNNPVILNVNPNIDFTNITIYCTNIITFIEKEYQIIELYNLLKTVVMDNSKFIFIYKK